MLLTADKIEQNKQEYISLLRSTGYPGMDNLIAWLESSDFFTAPASTLYHSNFKGGLCQHSLNVYYAARALESAIMPLSHKFNNSTEPGSHYDPEEVIVAALLHDLCKVGIYLPKIKWMKDSQNNWVSYEGYEVIDKQLPLGHGEKSLFFAQQFIQMKLNTILAIRWHMHSFAQTATPDEFTKYPMIAAMEGFPLVNIIMQADCFASFNMEDKIDPKTFITSTH